MLGAVTALLPPLDLSALLQYVATALLLAFGFLVLLKNAASRYFVVDTGFDSVGEPQGRARHMSIGRSGRGDSDGDGDGGGGGGGSGGGGDRKCFVCGKDGSKTCGRCRSVRYCSLDCQSQHWKTDHKSKCRKKESGLVALVPGRGVVNVLQQPKKILFPYDEFRNLYYWDKQVFPPCGLLNCGNSCFANVVLQCLSCTRPLVGYLLEAVHSRQCRRNDWCFLCELQSHVQRVSQSLRPFSPANILSQLPNIGCHLGYGRQEDAHEFMRFAIDTMQSVCLDEFGGEKVLDPSSQETSIIQHIFGGLLQSQVICTKCNVVSNRYENMMDLTVEIQGDAESLEDCLIQFTAKEWLDGENMYKCDGCNDYVKALKQLTVHRPPNILTVTLKRFQSGRFGKLNKRVAFPETLDLGPYMSCNGEGDNLYRLYAVVVHLDMLNASFFGHYICYTKDFSGNWYRVDDCKVIKVEPEEVLSQGAYMLLYSRLHARQPKPLPTTEENVFQQEQDPVNSTGTLIRNNISVNSGINTENQGKKDMTVDECVTSFLDDTCHNLKKIKQDINGEDSLPLKDLAARKISLSSSDENRGVEPQLPLQKSQDDCILPGQNESNCNFRQGDEVPNTNETVHTSVVSTFSPRSTQESLEVVIPSLTNFSVESKLDQTIENHSSNESEGLCNNKRAKAPPGISGRPMCREETKPLFSRGFLDNPSRKKPIHQARKVRTKNDLVGPFVGNDLSEVQHSMCGNSKPLVSSNFLDKDVDIEGTGQTENGGLSTYKDVNGPSNCSACMSVKQSLHDQKSCQELTTFTPIHPRGDHPMAVHRSDLQDNGYYSSGRTCSTETCQSKESECDPVGHKAYEGSICANSERNFPETRPFLGSNGLKGCQSSVPEICNCSLSDVSMPVFSHDFLSESNKSHSLSIEDNLSGRPSMKVTSGESEQSHQNHDSCQDSPCASGMNKLSNLKVFNTHEPPCKQYNQPHRNDIGQASLHGASCSDFTKCNGCFDTISE